MPKVFAGCSKRLFPYEIAERKHYIDAFSSLLSQFHGSSSDHNPGIIGGVGGEAGGGDDKSSDGGKEGEEEEDFEVVGLGSSLDSRTTRLCAISLCFISLRYFSPAPPGLFKSMLPSTSCTLMSAAIVSARGSSAEVRETKSMQWESRVRRGWSRGKRDGESGGTMEPVSLVPREADERIDSRVDSI